MRGGRTARGARRMFPPLRLQFSLREGALLCRWVGAFCTVCICRLLFRMIHRAPLRARARLPRAGLCAAEIRRGRPRLSACLVSSMPRHAPRRAFVAMCHTPMSRYDAIAPRRVCSHPPSDEARVRIGQAMFRRPRACSRRTVRGASIMAQWRGADGMIRAITHAPPG